MMKIYAHMTAIEAPRRQDVNLITSPDIMRTGRILPMITPAECFPRLAYRIEFIGKDRVRVEDPFGRIDYVRQIRKKPIGLKPEPLTHFYSLLPCTYLG